MQLYSETVESNPDVYCTLQLSGGAPSAPSPAPSSQLLELQEELQKVQRNVQRTAAERDQALSDLAALRDSLMQQQEDNARRVSVL